MISVGDSVENLGVLNNFSKSELQFSLEFPESISGNSVQLISSGWIFRFVVAYVLVAKRKACLQPEKTQGYQYLFAVQFFNSYVYRGRLVAGLDKVFENRDRHHRIRRQILRQNEGLIWFLAQS